MLLRGEGDVDPAARRETRLTQAGGRRRLDVDVFVVPSFLFLIARDLLVRDPPRVLAWRLLHDPQLASLSGWLGALLPRPHPDVDRDPIALVLASAAALIAASYLIAALLGVGARVRAALLGLAAAVLVVAPAAGFIAMGYATGRPYGQDGGVVQLPLALDKILAGESPYAADYSDSILGKEARVSKFWATRGGNPILRHHAYLPGTHLIAMPAHLASQAAGVRFDPRLVTFVFYFLAAYLATRVVTGAPAQLTAAAAVLVNPLLYWHQIFGANDIMFVAMVLGAVALLQRERPLTAAAVLGLACGTKQLAWPFAPFLLLVAAGVRWPLVEDWRPVAWRLVRVVAVAALVFAAVVTPVAALDFRAFYADIVGYNVGLPGADNYPLGGTPGFGFANFLIYFGRVRSLGEYFPFSIFYLFLVPLGLLLVRATLRKADDPRHVLMFGATALVASLYLSRVVHPNYLIPPAILLPIAALGSTVAADVVLVPLLLLSLAVEVSEQSPLQRLWEDALASRLPAHVDAPWSAFLPRTGFDLTDDPLALAWSAVAAGLAMVYLAGGALGVGARVRAALATAAVVLAVIMPARVVVAIGERTGTVRAQDEWVPETRAAANALLRIDEASVTAREAWSASFRQEPPRLLTAERAGAPAGEAWLAAVWRPFGRDPRVVSMVCALLLVALMWWRAAAGVRPLLLGLLLVPPAATTVVFGGPHLLALAGLAAALVVSVRVGLPWRAAGQAVAAGASLVGAAGVVAGGPRLRALIVGLAAGIVPAWLAAGAMRLGEPGPGASIVNFATYFGYAVGPMGAALLFALAVAASVLIGRAARRFSGSPWLAAAAAASAAIVLLPSSPDAVLLPLGSLLLAAADQAAEPPES